MNRSVIDQIVVTTHVPSLLDFLKANQDKLGIKVTNGFIKESSTSGRAFRICFTADSVNVVTIWSDTPTPNLDWVDELIHLYLDEACHWGEVGAIQINIHYSPTNRPPDR